MKVFYDTEFLEDGRAIDLISIGMVAEDGRELYAVAEEIETDKALHGRITRHEWLMKNVIPHLPMAPRADYLAPVAWDRDATPPSGRFGLDFDSAVVLPRRIIRNQVRTFLQATPDLELWAWYGAYDHVVLAQLFGPMIDLPESVPMWTNDLKQECQRVGNPKLPKQESAAHNALEDARWVRDAFYWLATSLEPPRALQSATNEDHSSPRSPAGAKNEPRE
jgi:hypothetical protein